MPRRPKNPSDLRFIEDATGVLHEARAVSRKNAIARADAFLAKNLLKHLKLLRELATGIKVMKPSKDGEESEVYMVPPDRQAIEYLVDRAMGKAQSRTELTGEGGGPVKIVPWLPLEELPQPEGGEIIDVTPIPLTLPASDDELVQQGEVKEGESEEAPSAAGGDQGAQEGEP